MSAPYKAGGTSESWVWLGFTLLGMSGVPAVLIFIHSRQSDLPEWALLFAAAPFLLALVAAFVVTARLKRQRIAKIKAEMEGRGLTVEISLTDSVRSHIDPHLNAFNFALDLRFGAASIQWVAFNPQMLVFEHEFTTGSGKSTQVHRKTVVAFSRPDSSRKWIFAVRPRFGEGWIYKQRLGQEIQLGEDAFDKQWLLYGDEDSLHRMLSFDVRQMLVDAPMGECWFADAKWLVVCYPSVFNSENLTRLIERGERIFAGK